MYKMAYDWSAVPNFKGSRPKSGDFDKKNDDTKFNPFCCFFSYLAKRIKIHIFAEKIKKKF